MSVKKIKIFLVLITTAFIILPFTNCNKIQMTDIALEGGVLGYGEPPDTSFVQQSCNNFTRQKMSINYFFPKPNQTCEWGKNGNLLERNDYFQARIEQ